MYPFVPEDIYEQVATCMVVAMREIGQLESAGSGTFKLQWFNEGTENQEEFRAAYFRAAKLARDRFRKLSVMRQYGSRGALVSIIAFIIL